MTPDEHAQRGRGQLGNLNALLDGHSTLHLRRGMSLLDFGCGKGAFLKAALDAGLDAYGVEPEQEEKAVYESLCNGDSAKLSRWRFYDGELLPFASQSFDMVFSWFALEHIQDLNQSLREMARVVKPGGAVVLFSQDARSAYGGICAFPGLRFCIRNSTKHT